MSKFIYIDCSNSGIEVFVEDEKVGSASVARELADVFVTNSISCFDPIYCSSSVDFCEDYGWEVGSVRKIIHNALNLVNP